MLKGILAAMLLGLMGLLVQCSPADEPYPGEQRQAQVDTIMTQRPIDSVLADHTNEFMKVPGVVGTGIGECDGKPCIKVFASARTTEIRTRIPQSLEGYPVEVVVTGEFKAHDST